jgi:signal transduction histidine kinase
LRKFVLPRMAVSLPLSILAATLLIFINELSFRESTAVVSSIDQAQKTRSALHTLMNGVLSAETGQRGFLLTGEDRHLQPYQVAIRQITQDLAKLRTLFAAQQEHADDFALMTSHIASKLEEMEVSVRMRREGNEDGLRLVLATDSANQHMEVIKTQVDKLAKATSERMEGDQAHIRQTLEWARIGMALLTIACLVAFYFYLLQTKALFDSGQREKDSLKRERDQLDMQVRERTENLAELATHLQNVREDERGHLARELHDELGALLTAAKLDVARIKSRMGNAIPEAAERLTHLTNTLNSGIALKRRIVEDLRPSSLSHLGLVASLEILAREFEERSGLSVITELETIDLDESAQLTVYRLVQESLTNIGKYAEATQAVVSLQNHDGFVGIEVRDNGKGFDLAAVGLSSHGLSGMRHRVEAAGGRLTVVSDSSIGTRISALLPKVT